MKKHTRFLLILSSLLILPFLPIMNPSAVSADSGGSTADELYKEGTKTVQVGTGMLVSPLFIKTHRRDLDYSMTFVRLGYLLTDPSEKRFLPRGNFEALVQVSGSLVTDGFGEYMLEYAWLLRYNVVYPNWRVFPYFQVGAGILYNDLYKDRTQDLIGNSVEFTPQGSVGLRWLLGKRWSLDVEGIYHHISNAGLGDRNVGVNAFGGFIGVTWFFGPSAK